MAVTMSAVLPATPTMVESTRRLSFTQLFTMVWMNSGTFSQMPHFS